MTNAGSNIAAEQRVAAELREKYVELLRLRELHARGDAHDPRRDLSALASRFPGALREIDQLTMEELRARLASLEAAIAGEGALLPWMHAQSRFHALTRGALCAKRWLSSADDASATRFEEAAPSFCWPEEALAWTGELARLASPPRGRVTDLVFERLARELETDIAAARDLVLPRKR